MVVAPSCSGRSGRSSNAQPRDGEVARGDRAVGDGLLEEQTRLREVGLRRDALAVAKLVDVEGALRLLGRARRWRATPPVPARAG